MGLEIASTFFVCLEWNFIATVLFTEPTIRKITKQNNSKKAILPVSLYLYCRKPSYDEFGKPRVTSFIYDRNQDIITEEDKEFKDVVSGWFSKWCHFKNRYR